ncbi:MAG TPA: DUF4492 domain-containing protein [Sulfurospirillum sp. UBA11407]|nr:MAG TPA: DUF4492 domain-containing protein [Sulfurospirillum sp. UBA11407]
MSILKKIFYFYIDGFKNMGVGKKLWLIIGVKFFIFFVVMKLLFFPNILQTQFSTDEQRADYVIENLVKER